MLTQSELGFAEEKLSPNDNKLIKKGTESLWGSETSDVMTFSAKL